MAAATPSAGAISAKRGTVTAQATGRRRPRRSHHLTLRRLLTRCHHRILVLRPTQGLTFSVRHSSTRLVAMTDSAVVQTLPRFRCRRCSPAAQGRAGAAEPRVALPPEQPEVQVAQARARHAMSSTVRGVEVQLSVPPTRCEPGTVQRLLTTGSRWPSWTALAREDRQSRSLLSFSVTTDIPTKLRYGKPLRSR